MKKICDLRCYVAIREGEYEDTSLWKHLRYCETGDTEEECVTSWDDLCDLVKGHHIRNAELTTNLFGNPVVKIGWADIYKSETKITYRNFKTLYVKWVADPYDKIYTIKDLAEMLPAEDFCEYLKDNGIKIGD